MADILDPTTGRLVVSGPQGEGGFGTQQGLLNFMAEHGINGRYEVSTMADGRVAYYLPGQFIQNGNREALGLPTSTDYTSVAPGAKAGAAATTPLAAAPKGDPVGAGTAASLLRQYGLDELLPYVDQIARGSLTWAELLAQLYDTGTTPGKAVDKLFPEIKMIRDKNLEPVSIDQIQQLRSQYRQAFRSVDAPEGFYDQPSDFTQFIVNQKSPDELKADLAEWRAVADEAAADPANATTLSELNRLHGITPDSGAFLAYVIDPTRGIAAIKQQVAAARISATASRAGFGPLDLNEANLLAARDVTDAQAQQGFTDLAHSQELFQAIPGEGGAGISRQDQLDAEFNGDSNARAAIDRVRGQRLGQFAGGGRTASGRDGSTGLVTV